MRQCMWRTCRNLMFCYELSGTCMGWVLFFMFLQLLAHWPNANLDFG
jgi:hypothetical protein